MIFDSIERRGKLILLSLLQTKGKSIKRGEYQPGKNKNKD
jgi:hypothetical protein